MPFRTRLCLFAVVDTVSAVLCLLCTAYLNRAKYGAYPALFFLSQVCRDLLFDMLVV